MGVVKGLRRCAAGPTSAAEGCAAARARAAADRRRIVRTGSEDGSMETLTIREAADACGMTYEAMRARVDRGTLRAGKRRDDGARMIPKSELLQAGLLPGADVVQLHSEIDQLRRELKEHRLLTERAQSETAAERQARELIEQSMHRERAERQTLQAQLEQIEQAQVEASSKLERLTDAGFFARRRILRELRRPAA